MTTEIVIIGLGTGGLYSSRAAQRYNRRAQITIFEKRDYHMFSPCGIPYAIEGRVESFDELMHSVPTTRSLHIYLKHEAVDGDPVAKKVKVRNIETDEERWIKYNSLILATGSNPVILPIPGAKDFLGKGVYTVSNPEDGKILRNAALNYQSAMVVGGGNIGMEIALALKHLGMDVHITKRSEPALPRNIDPDIGNILVDHIKEKGLHVHFGKGIDSINGKDMVESVTIAGEEIPVDLVVMAVGVKSNIDLAGSMGVECPDGSILTNSKMETNFPNVYAVGDNCWSFNMIDGSRIRVALATTAYRQAIVAGVNAAGGDIEYDGNLGTFVSYIGDLEISATGYNISGAEDAGYQVVSGRVNSLNKPSWIPEANEISIKIIADVATGKLLGGQAIGKEGTDWRINMIALGIKKDMTIKEFSTVELAYCPTVSKLYDPLLIATDITIMKLDAMRKRIIGESSARNL